MLKTYVRPARHPAFTPGSTCSCVTASLHIQADEDLTFDHLVPRSKGGITTWENVVAACSPCNLAKGGHLPGEVDMWPENRPVRPTVQRLHANGRLFPPNYLHESWADFLYWDTVLGSLDAQALSRRACPKGRARPGPRTPRHSSRQRTDREGAIAPRRSGSPGRCRDWAGRPTGPRRCCRAGGPAHYPHSTPE